MENEKTNKAVYSETVEIIKKEIITKMTTLEGRPVEYIKQEIINIVVQNGLSIEQLKSLQEPTATISLDNLNLISVKNMYSSIDRLAEDISKNNINKTKSESTVSTPKPKKSVTINFTIKENNDITTLPKDDVLKMIEHKLRDAFLAAGYDESFLQRTGDSLGIKDSSPAGNQVSINCFGKTFLESWCETIYNLFNTKNIEKTKEETEKSFASTAKNNDSKSSQQNPESKTESKNSPDFGTLSY